MNVIPFKLKKEECKLQLTEILYDQLQEIERTIEELEIKIARKEKWIYSGILRNHNELYQRYQRELEQLQKDRANAEVMKKECYNKMIDETKVLLK